MAHFTQDFLDFFNDLAKHNNKEWFDANRKRYENSVKKPFAVFVDAVIARMREQDPAMDITAKDAVARINRDIRFSPDKTPYNTHVGAFLSPAGRKDKTVPGGFVRIDSKKMLIAGGAYYPEKDQLQRIRAAIAADLAGFEKLLNEPDFKSRFGGLPGEKHKRVPPEFKEAAEKQPLIFNKQFHYFTEIDARVILKPEVVDVVTAYFNAAGNMLAFLREAIG